MPVLLQSSINQHDISINQDTIYVYLDNEQKKSGSDYAILMRNYSNTIGLIVKEKPSDAEKSYWSDSIFPSKRELLEETNLSGNVKKIIGTCSHHKSINGGVLLVGLQMEILEWGCIEPGDDASEALLFDITTLPKLAFTCYSKILKLYLNKK